jgi:hypothetical protein
MRTIEIILRIGEVLALFWCVSYFDYLRDAIADYKNSAKFWLYKWCLKHPEYLPWLDGHHSLPYFEKKGIQYDPGKVWLCDAWHMAKSFLLVSFIGVVAALAVWVFVLLVPLRWYFQVTIQLGLWWLLYWIEGELFNEEYDKLKTTN